MQIILEGPDNSGKTTLAKHLGETLGIPVKHSGGPSKFPGEVNSRTQAFNEANSWGIFDRHPAISQNMYVEALSQLQGEKKGELVRPEHVEAFYNLKPLIIYCRNVRGIEGHDLSEHSSADYFDKVTRAMPILCKLYDQWALERAHILYRIGDNMTDVVNTVAAQLWGTTEYGGAPAADMLADIAAFHKKFDIAYSGRPRLIPGNLYEFRTRFQTEEHREMDEAWARADFELSLGNDEAEFIHALEKQLDAFIDQAYVLFGTVHLAGMTDAFVKGWERVHAANMKKVRAERAEDSVRNSTFDVIKPAGWEPPKLTDLVEDHAHQDQFEGEE